MTQIGEAVASDSGARRTKSLASIIVNNFNYGRFLRQAIDSALNQEYPHIEVIVVDDGSTDDSREIIASYGSRIRPVLKPNGGQASALNAGFAASRGDLVIFLDADDILFPEAVTNVVPRLFTEGVSKVHWPMWVIDASGKRTGGTRPSQVPPEGDFRQQVLERGPSNVASSPTSGNAWSRSFLEKILPIPEEMTYYRSCADEYLYLLAPVFGQVRTLTIPQGCYRIHSKNIYSSRSFREKLDIELSGYTEQCKAMESALARNAISVDVKSWQQHSWFHRLDRAIAEVLAIVPEGGEFILIDGNTWGVGRQLEGRSVRSFFEHAGVDWGHPEDDEVAINQLHSIITMGTPFVVICWPCFWWIDEYEGFFERLHEASKCVHRSDTSMIFDLQNQSAIAAGSQVPEIVKDGHHNV